MRLRYNLRDDKKLQAFLGSLPYGLVKVVLPAFAEYIKGDMRHGLMHYQPYKYVSRKRAYGKTFKSDRQRRFVMAAIREGRIDPGFPHRTGNTQRAYKIVTSNRGYRVSIVNPKRGAIYTRDDHRQARLNALAGWKKTAVVIANNWKGAMRHVNAEVKKYLKRR